MARRGIRWRTLRAAAAVLLGGSIFQLGGCDPAVRDVLLTGLSTTTSTLAQTFVTAFFTSLAEEDDGSLTTTP